VTGTFGWAIVAAAVVIWSIVEILSLLSSPLFGLAPWEEALGLLAVAGVSVGITKYSVDEYDL
jgi:hypothetical protein